MILKVACSCECLLTMYTNLYSAFAGVSMYIQDCHGGGGKSH